MLMSCTPHSNQNKRLRGSCQAWKEISYLKEVQEAQHRLDLILLEHMKSFNKVLFVLYCFVGVAIYLVTKGLRPRRVKRVRSKVTK
mmetsp:Transcript_10327/g.26198  ORF Transcript_10327/g.26198 Transcript_10327/m.26198 type:complete len:86 (+) Transcript_10327:824-1081(+)